MGNQPREEIAVSSDFFAIVITVALQGGWTASLAFDLHAFLCIPLGVSEAAYLPTTTMRHEHDLCRVLKNPEDS